MQPAPLSTEQKLLIVRRFSDVTIVRTDTMKLTELYNTVEQLFAPHEFEFSRLMDIWRMPNLLLHGSDTIGPDYSDSFTDLIHSEGLKEHIQRVKQSFLAAGRSVNPGEAQLAQGQNALYVAPPHTTQNDMNFLNRSTGSVLVFFKPEIMKPLHISGQLYKPPPIEAVSGMFLSWTGEIHIQPVSL